VGLTKNVNLFFRGGLRRRVCTAGTHAVETQQTACAAKLHTLQRMANNPITNNGFQAASAVSPKAA